MGGQNGKILPGKNVDIYHFWKCTNFFFYKISQSKIISKAYKEQKK